MLSGDFGGDMQRFLPLILSVIFLGSQYTLAAEITECPLISEINSKISDTIEVEHTKNNEFIIQIAKGAVFNKYRWDIQTMPIAAETKDKAIKLYNDKIHSLSGPNYVVDTPPSGLRGSTTCYYKFSNKLEVVAIKHGRDYTMIQWIGGIGGMDVGIIAVMLVLLLV